MHPLEKACSFILQHRYREALYCFKKASRAYQKQSTVWQGMGHCYTVLEEPLDAIIALEAARKCPHLHEDKLVICKLLLANFCVQRAVKSIKETLITLAKLLKGDGLSYAILVSEIYFHFPHDGVEFHKLLREAWTDHGWMPPDHEYEIY